MKAFLLTVAALSIVPVFGATPWEDLHRVPIPAALPPHPRVFCTAADLARIRADYARRDPYTVSVWERVVSSAELALADEVPEIPDRPSGALLAQAANLGQAYALTGDERFGSRCHALLLAISRAVMPLERTRSAGLMAARTLEEGPLAINFSMAYDLAASFPGFAEADHELVRAALRRVGWEAGHWCNHLNSSNWRSWALCIQAVCGFAAGDRQLIEEAINGSWDPQRNAYLYGIVQQLTHSVFSDGVHWERCMGYTYYTGSALMYTLVAAKNSGIDLWHAELPGILGPFVGGANHEEFGPEGNRSFKAFLDAPFYYAFPGGGFARIGDSNTPGIAYHPMYELAWREYGDPKYAWLIRRERDRDGVQAPAHWQVWRARGEPEWRIEEGEGRMVARFATKEGERIALVQNVRCPGDQPLVVSGRVKALHMAGGKAHIRCNLGRDAHFTESVAEAGDWRELRVVIPPAEDGAPRRVRLHVFLETGEGEVLWDHIQARSNGTGPNLVFNGTFVEGNVEGRRTGFWDLVNGVAEVPEGEYDLTQDATIGLSGRHVNGSTLFPIGGFAILRNRPNDPESLAVNLSFGPYGSGHCHPDQLTVTVHALGRTVCPDAGIFGGYDDPMHLTWANQTVAHNTVSINEISQAPQGLSRSIWASERGDQRVFGVLRLFHSGPHLKAVRATCDTSYPGTRLDRTVCLVGPYLLDVYRVAGETEQTIDLPLHGRGEVASETATTLLAENPFSGLGYTHFEEVRQGRADGWVRAAFTEEDRRVDVLQLAPPGSELYLMRDPSRPGQPVSTLMARVRASEAAFVTVLAPSRAGRTVESVDVRPSGEGLLVEVVHGQGTDRFLLPAATNGGILLERRDRQGNRLADETAVPAP